MRKRNNMRLNPEKNLDCLIYRLVSMLELARYGIPSYGFNLLIAFAIFTK